MPGRAVRATSLPQRFVNVWRRAAVRLRRSRVLARVDRYDVAALLLFATLIALVAFTFADYAISNDEEVQQRYGEMIIAYYASGFVDQALSSNKI